MNLDRYTLPDWKAAIAALLRLVSLRQTRGRSHVCISQCIAISDLLMDDCALDRTDAAVFRKAPGCSD